MVGHKDALERHLADKWRDLFGASFDVLLYDLTSTYFEGEAEGVEKAARGYSRDHRPDRAQLVIAVVVTPEGFPLPKYSPELNAQERLWHYTRREATHNRFFEKPADLCGSLFRTFDAVQKHPEKIQGLLAPFF